MKNMKRALRRHHRARMVARATKVRIQWNWGKEDEWTSLWARRAADNLAVCSCYMCGNPRKHFNELTIQEKRNLDKAEYEETFEPMWTLCDPWLESQ